MEACIALLETVSVARGIEAADAMLKEAAVRLRLSRPVQPGKHATLVSGDVEAVRRALRRGREVAGDKVVDHLFLAYAHPSVLRAAFLDDRPDVAEALGIVETFTIASTLLAADASAKATSAELLLVRLADGLGGKGYFLVTGTVEDVEASVRAADDRVAPAGHLQSRVVIPAVHPELVPFLVTRDRGPDSAIRAALLGETED